MAYENDNYEPNAKSQQILERAWQHVQGVPYRVTARWLFYRLIQEGFYQTKQDYKNRFLPLLSRARHNKYRGWRPDTLADDSRSAITRGDGYSTAEGWGRAVAKEARCKLARWKGQKQYVELWFEAEAMRGQFEYYTDDITMRPFGGMPSIPYKWEMAKNLEEAHASYGLPLVVLYFGDLDPAGLIIPETSIADVRKWCAVRFEVVRCGLNAGHEVQYSIPENYEKPGTYQWEALEDGPAGRLITSAVACYVDYSAMAEIEAKEDQATTRFREYARRFVDDRAWEA